MEPPVKDVETITAVATARGCAGVGIIRISGPDALGVAEKFFNPSGKITEYKPQRLYYGTIKNPANGCVIDTGYLVFMKAPRSYTGEDTVELQCHGGALILQNIIQAVLASGARMAEPGEFTKRAFLNGKLDLAQAEAVSSLILAKSESALGAARGRLDGRLSKKVNAIKEELVWLLTHVEAELDFPEDEVEALSVDKFVDVLDRVEMQIEKILKTYEQGRALTEGVRVLILGRPNVGKSSLLNVLLKEDRAIVTELAGTTRDLLEEVVVIKGIPVKLMDTAGLRHTTDRIESIGVERAKESITKAELILFVVDASARNFVEDLKELESIHKEAGGKEKKKILIVLNKKDLIKKDLINNAKNMFAPGPAVYISAKKESGIEALEEKIFELVAGHGSSAGFSERDPGEMIATVHQKDALTKTFKGIERVRQGLDKKIPHELLAVDLRWSVDRLGEITGETTTEDILDRIFSSFCIGK